MNYVKMKEVKLYDADTLEYAGSIILDDGPWYYKDVKNDFLVQTTTGMPVKAAMQLLISFNLVYDIIEG